MGLLVGLLALSLSAASHAHPLRLSLTEIEYTSEDQRLTVSLRLFLMDVREALLFDPEDGRLAFCQPDEAEQAERLLTDYLTRYFQVIANGRLLDLEIASKKLTGEGDNIALSVTFDYVQDQALTALEVKNTVFTDLFFDQNNIVYVHVDQRSDSFMLSKDTPTHRLDY